MVNIHNMLEWGAVHCTFVEEPFFKCGESYARTQRAFCKHFSIVPCKLVPNRNSLNIWVENSQERYHYEIKASGASQFECQKTTNACINPSKTVQQDLIKNTLQSCTWSQVQYITYFTRTWNYHPYKLLMTQLQRWNHATRLNFGQRMLQAIEEEQLAMDNILITDKAYCYLHGHVNNQKCATGARIIRVLLKSNLYTPPK